METIIKNIWILYPFSIVLFTAITLKLGFKATPNWFKKFISIFWGVVLGVITYLTNEVNIMVLIFGFGFAIYFYDNILKKLKALNYDDGKGLIK